MPQIEIHTDVVRVTDAHAASLPLFDELADQVAICVAQTYEVAAETIGVFFVDNPANRSTRHATSLRARPRVFVKVHAMHRPAALRSQLGRALAQLLADVYGVHANSVAVYFLERNADEIAYGDGLISERS